MKLETKDLINKIFTKVYVNEDKTTLSFENETEKFIYSHDQVCCESVYIEAICNDLTVLENSTILMAEEICSENSMLKVGAAGEYLSGFSLAEDYYDNSQTWTFYKFATVKGWVDVRWYGESNGYYSETVNLTYESYK